MNANAMQSEVGKVIVKELNGLKVELRVNDVKFSYGVKRYLVSVVGQNSGAVWMNA